VLLHGNQTLNTVYVTEDRSDEFLEKMATAVSASAGDAVCFGHTHKPWQRVVNGVRFVNAGSVGRPKDGDPRACYILLSVRDSGIAAEFVRVEYDVELVAREIVKRGLPAEFATVVRTGGNSPVPSTGVGTY
jgi:predicted phosphodiesterase